MDNTFDLKHKYFTYQAVGGVVSLEAYKQWIINRKICVWLHQ